MQKWTEVKLDLPPSYFHTMTPCYDPERKLENIIVHKTLEKKSIEKTHCEGIFIFDLNLKVIEIDNNSFNVVEPKTSGGKPCAR